MSRAVARSRTRPRPALVLAMLLLLLLPLQALAARAAHPSCQPDPSAVEELERVDLYTSRCLPVLPCVDDTLEAAQRLAAAHPDDVVVHRTLQTLVERSYPIERRRDVHQRLRDQWGERAAARPDDPVAAYFDARLAGERDERIAAYRAALETAPDFPWTHLGLAYDLFHHPEGGEEEKTAAAAHLEAFLDT